MSVADKFDGNGVNSSVPSHVLIHETFLLTNFRAPGQ
jgi:hypothetical protein